MKIASSLEREGPDPIQYLQEEVLPRVDPALLYADLEPKEHADYFVCRCPSCGQREAFVYKPSPSRRSYPLWLRCNRRNECGKAVSPTAYRNGGQVPRGARFFEIARELAELAGVELGPLAPRRLSGEQERAHHSSAGRREVLERTFWYGQESLTGSLSNEGSDQSLGYLMDERGLTLEGIARLEIGFYESTQMLESVLADEGLVWEALRDSAVLWEKLEGYILFPWRDESGSPLTIYGRWPGTPPEGRPKTIALPGEGTKRSPLYLDRAIREGLREVVLVEGVLDAALLQDRGESGTIACVGAGLTGEQAKTLARRGIRLVTVALDPDKAGEKGTISTIRNLSELGVQVAVAPTLPDGLDPDEFVLREGVEGWRAHLSGAIPGLVWEALLPAKTVTPESPLLELEAVVREVAEKVEGLRGSWASAHAETVLEVLSERTGWSGEALAPILEAADEARRKETAERRLQEALEIAENEGGEDPFKAARALEGRLKVLFAERQEDPPPFEVARILEETRTRPEGRGSGWSGLDTALGLSFEPGELSILAARTGHGKTTALVGILANWLEETPSGERILFYSSEETEARIFERLSALFWPGGATREKVLAAFRGDESGGELAKTLDTLRSFEGRLQVVHRPAWGTDEITAHARREVDRTGEVSAVFVDYLQRIRAPEGQHERRDIEVSAVAREFHVLAEDLGAPVLAAAQINRDAIPPNYAKTLEGKTYAEAREKIRPARPALHNLREGGLEQEAALVLGLLCYAADFNHEAGESSAGPPATSRFEIGTLKARFGQVGRWASLAFEGARGALRDPQPTEEDRL